MSNVAGFEPLIHPGAWIHSLAEVDRMGVRVGARTKIWQFASVIRRSCIGRECNIASCATVDGARLGDRVHVEHGAAISPGIRLGDDVFVGLGAKFCNDVWPRTYKDGWFDMEDLISGQIVVSQVDNGASIGAGAVIMPGITIGARAMVAAGAIVRHDVPPGFLYRDNGNVERIRKVPGQRRRFVVARDRLLP